jgi:adenosine deaminase
MARLAGEDTILCVAPSSNLATGAITHVSAHPLKKLLDAGVRVTLSADDPALFSTTTAGEYRFAREKFGLADEELHRVAGNAFHAAFCSAEERSAGLKGLQSGLSW